MKQVAALFFLALTLPACSENSDANTAQAVSGSGGQTSGTAVAGKCPKGSVSVKLQEEDMMEPGKLSPAHEDKLICISQKQDAARIVTVFCKDPKKAPIQMYSLASGLRCPCSAFTSYQFQSVGKRATHLDKVPAAANADLLVLNDIVVDAPDENSRTAVIVAEGGGAEFPSCGAQ